MWGGDLFAAAWEKSTDAAKKAASAVATGAEFVGQSAWEGSQIIVGTAIKGAKSVGNSILETSKKALEVAKDFRKVAWEKSKQFSKKALDGVREVSRVAWEGAKKIGSEFIDGSKWVVETTLRLAVKAQKAILKLGEYAFKVATELPGASVFSARWITEDKLGMPNIICTLRESIGDWVGSDIGSEEAKEILPMAELSDNSYVVNGELPPDHDYERLKPPQQIESLMDKISNPDNLLDDESGFKAALYRNKKDGSIVLAFAGTDDWEDIVANFSQGMGNVPQQYHQAQMLTETVKMHYGDSKLTITGHSLGGGLATYAGLQTETSTTVFNAVGLSTGAREEIGDKLITNAHLINNYNVIGEGLSDPLGLGMGQGTFGWRANQVGRVEWIPSSGGEGPVGRHLLSDVIPSLQTVAGGD